MLFTSGEAFVSAHAHINYAIGLAHAKLFALKCRDGADVLGPTIPSTTSFCLAPSFGGNRLSASCTFFTSSAKLRQRAASPTAAFAEPLPEPPPEPLPVLHRPTHKRRRSMRHPVT